MLMNAPTSLYVLDNKVSWHYRFVKNMTECVSECVGEYIPVSYHDGSNYDGAVLHAGGVIRKQRRVLDQHQFVCVVPVADLQG